MASILATSLSSRILPTWRASVTLSKRTFTEVVRQQIPPFRTPVPGARPESIQSAGDFLKAIGRASETKLSPETWEALWKMDGPSMKAAGLAVRDRRYILWCMEKYRLGFPIRDFAHEPSPKKTIRGWGPKVQNGKRIRSKRIKNKS